jgi:hypothetical protein
MSAIMELPATKQCTKCGEVKALVDFAMDKSNRCGARSACRNCEKERVSRYYADNKEKEKERVSRYYADNKKKVKERASLYRAENAGKRKEYQSRYRADNRENLKERASRYYAENKEKLKERASRYRARQKAMSEFFKMHRAMHAIAETLNQMKP